jgi:hypothetical protein
MRFLITSLLALGLGGSIAAHAETPPPVKTFQIWNNENPTGTNRATIYPVLEVGIKSAPVGDDWLIGWFQNGGAGDGVTVAKGNFTTTRIYRLYVNAGSREPGIAPGEAVEVTLPFFTRLVAFPPSPGSADQYVDWWNGGRTYMYDDVQALMRFKADSDLPPLPSGAVGPSCRFLGVNSWKKW